MQISAATPYKRQQTMLKRQRRLNFLLEIQFQVAATGDNQCCGLGLDVSVLRRYRDIPTSRSRLEKNCQCLSLEADISVSVLAIYVSCPRPIFSQIVQATVEMCMGVGIPVGMGILWEWDKNLIKRGNVTSPAAMSGGQCCCSPCGLMNARHRATVMNLMAHTEKLNLNLNL